jgi:hypothetical protein
MARKLCLLAEGFREISNILHRSLSRTRGKVQTPASIMAAILARPELVDQIAMYATGDQAKVAEVLPFAGKNTGDLDRLRKRLPTLMGYWLYDSILRFPGLLVNSVAAASYLNIAVEKFQKVEEVQKLFESALYSGPFKDSENPLWWRGALDDLLSEAGCQDGRALVQKHLQMTVAECRCSIDARKRAGFYCMATGTPVSAQSSKGNISWFPPGADLARIRNDVYDEIGPWVGLY